MKKTVLGLLLAVQLSSCASMAQDGMSKTEYQKKPIDGSHRKVHVGWLLGDIALIPFWPIGGFLPIIIDFWNGRIYQQYPKGFYPNDIRATKNSNP